MSPKVDAGGERSLDLLRLPEELAEFLSRDTFSMIVKGGSGTGKTILALTMLKALRPLENVLYVSTRTSPLELFESYPWIEEIFGPPGLASSGRTSTEGWESLADSRLDEPSAVFERVTNVLMDRKAPTVVIDSWEAMGDALGGEELSTDLRVLDSWRERAGARFVFIGEDPAESAVDHLVDGVVVLSERTVEARRVRELNIGKLRGTEVRRPSYFFTLDGGEFRAFPDYSPDDYEFRKPLPVTLDRTLRAPAGRYSTGHASLDAAIRGGFPARSVAHLEVGEGVDEKVPLVFLSNLVRGWAKGGGTVKMGELPDVEPGFLRQYVKSYAARGGKGAKGKKTLAIVSGESPGAEAPADLTISIEPEGKKRRGPAGAGVRIKMSLLEGSLFFRGEVPWTPLFGAIPGAVAGNPQIRLEPVV